MDSDTDPTAQLTPDATTHLIEIIGDRAGFTLIDKVGAAQKPNSGGIYFHVNDHSDGKLEIDATDDDQLIETTASTSSSTTVKITDATHSTAAFDTMGVGIRDLAIRTNQVVATNPGDGTVASIPKFYPSHNLTIDTGVATYDTIELGGDGDDNEVLNVDVTTGAGHDVVKLLDDDDNDGITTANIDFGGSGLNLDNSLEVHAGAVATLMKSSGAADHTLYVDNVHLYLGSTSNAHPNARGGTLVVADPADIGTLRVEDQSEADIEASSTIGTFIVESGGLADVTAASDIPIFFITGAAIVEAPIVSSEFTVEGSGATGLFKVTQPDIGTLTIDSGGVVTLQQRSSAPIVTAARVLRVTSLSIGSGKLNLQDNDVIVDYSGSTPIGSWNGTSYTNLIGYVASGRNGGGWTGNGIVTSQTNATSGSFTSIGIAEKTDLYGTDTAVFAGFTLDNTAVLIKYTYGGDANLDGKINVDDYGRIDFNVNLGTSGWYNGDFNYDGKINVDDYGIIDFNVGIQGPPL